MNSNKQKIVDRFNSNVKGQKFEPLGFNARHDGKEGHWLEAKMGITPNGNNEPDLFGYEMKKQTTSKTTFGDWSPNISLWGRNRPYENISKLDRDSEFLRYFGKPNTLKENRLSWSGEPAPTIKSYNIFGQKLIVDEHENIIAIYSFSKDQRINKYDLIPSELQREELIIAKWLKDSIKTKVERKFNNKGWFKCFKNAEGIYTHIGFGKPITYSDWIQLVKDGIVFFDSGMYAGNKRPYAQWRANNNYWDSLVTEVYK